MPSKGDQTKRKIVEETAKLVQVKGFEATSMKDVSEATGMQKGCLYFHFTGKDELLLAVLEKSKDEFLAKVDGALTGKTPGEKLDRFLRGVLENQRAMGFTGGCIFGNMAAEMSDKDQRVSVFVRRLFDEWGARILVVVREAQDSGQVTSAVAPEVLARHIIMALEGGIMLSRLEKREAPLKEVISSLRTLIGLER